MVRIPRVDDAFSGILELEASPVGGQQVEQRDKKRKNQRQKKIKKNEKSRSLSCPNNLTIEDVSGNCIGEDKK